MNCKEHLSEFPKLLSLSRRFENRRDLVVRAFLSNKESGRLIVRVVFGVVNLTARCAMSCGIVIACIPRLLTGNTG